jgi:hypothetical protein
MQNIEAAKAAKRELEGKSMYLSSDTNVMRIQYSQMQKIEITQESERAKDYTRIESSGQINTLN